VAGKYRCRVCLVKCGARSPCSTVLVKVAGKSDRGRPSTSEEPSHLFRRQILKLKSCNNVNKNLMATSANGGTTLALITIAMLGVCIQKVCSGGRDGGVSSSCHSTHCQPHGTSDKDRRKHRLQHKPGSRHRIFYKLQMQSVMPNACPISLRSLGVWMKITDMVNLTLKWRAMERKDDALWRRDEQGEVIRAVGKSSHT
jgi:hypothetical protein